MKYLYFSCLLLITISCQKENATLTSIKKVWEGDNPFNKLALTWEPIMYKNMAIYCWDTKTTESNHNMPIEARNLETGEVKWTWNDYFADLENGGGVLGATTQHVYQNVLVFSLSTALYAVDLETGQTLWRKKIELGAVYLRSMGSVFFNSVNNLERSAYHIVKGDTWTGTLDTVFSYTEDEYHMPHISVPYPYINNVGDTMLVFTNIAYKLGDPMNGKREMYFYNMSADTLAMKYDSLTAIATGSRILVQDGKVFFGGSKVSCYDANTYQKLWERAGCSW